MEGEEGVIFYGTLGTSLRRSGSGMFDVWTAYLAFCFLLYSF